jgi:3'-phosphoadenosine 5'-phosphosulfate sulfotransferase
LEGWELEVSGLVGEREPVEERESVEVLEPLEALELHLED